MDDDRRQVVNVRTVGLYFTIQIIYSAKGI
jgi:hypothetical protein